MSGASTPDPGADPQHNALLQGALGEPFAYLGPHRIGASVFVRTFQPGAHAVEVFARETGRLVGQLTQIGNTGVFAGPLSDNSPYYLRMYWAADVQESEDPYSFGLLLTDFDLHLFNEGRLWALAETLGAVRMAVEGIEGVRFAVWAPNARRVSVVGDFNLWDGRRHPMRQRHQAGIWELFVPRLTSGARYKFEIMGPDGSVLPQRADPLARATERPPATASVVASRFSLRWTDDDWIRTRSARQASTAPISIYEVHAASWLRPEGDPGNNLDWKALAEILIPYVSDLGFTHVELLPVMEHPFGGSWGYQPLSQFAPSARYGEPQELAHFVDTAHRAGIGVILDWVPAHFPGDAHGLAQFDGTALYEYADPREGFHRDWNTLIYDLGRREVQEFLIASALYWLRTFHIDGLRVDAVASMLYRDYSRNDGEWVANCYGGRENLEAIAFLQNLNVLIAEYCPGAITIAEESTTWPGVSAPVDAGGLGFSYKWNMGWMHDTLDYFGRDPVYRRWHHDQFSFSTVYAWSERYVLPLSHDEVVHSKGSLYGRMPGDPWQKCANLRACLAAMWTHPGKKLLFMGGEIAQPSEWSHDGELNWALLDDPLHAGMQRLVGDLNRLYVSAPQLHASDFDPAGFRWIIANDDENSVFAYERHDGSAAPLVVVLNLTPGILYAYRVGVELAGCWSEVLNTDSFIYGGSNAGNAGAVESSNVPAHGRDHSLALTLPPLAAIVLRYEG